MADKTAYFALFQCHLNYGILIQGADSQNERIPTAKKVIRVIDGDGTRDCCKPAFIRTGIN